MREQAGKFDGFWIIGLLALLAYVLPALFNPGRTLSPGAYDLAELLAKRNIDRTAYLTMLALRGQLFLITLLFAIRIRRPYFTANRWSHAFICGLLIIAQLPPLTFFTNLNDVNQQQQAMLAGTSFLVTLVGLSGYVWTYRYGVTLVASIVGIISIVYGVFNAIDIINDYALPAYTGIGGIALMVIYGILLIWSAYKLYRP